MQALTMYQWQIHSTLSSGNACFPPLVSTLHYFASLWSVAAGHITPEVFYMGQQSQVETFHWFLPCSLQSYKHSYGPGLLLVLLLLVFAIEYNPQQNISIKLLAILVGTGILQMWAWVSGGGCRNCMVSWCSGKFICSEPDHLSCFHLLCQTFRGKSACSRVHLCLHSTGNIPWDLCILTGIVQYTSKISIQE